MDKPLDIVVLISGSGSNLQAIIDQIAAIMGNSSNKAFDVYKKDKQGNINEFVIHNQEKLAKKLGISKTSWEKTGVDRIYKRVLDAAAVSKGYGEITYDNNGDIFTLQLSDELPLYNLGSPSALFHSEKIADLYHDPERLYNWIKTTRDVSYEVFVEPETNVLVISSDNEKNGYIIDRKTGKSTFITRSKERSVINSKQNIERIRNLLLTHTSYEDDNGRLLTINNLQ